MKMVDLVGKYITHESPHVRNRAAIVLMILNGKPPGEIATEIGLSLRTVKKWKTAWETDGLLIFPEIVSDTDTLQDQQILDPAIAIEITHKSPYGLAFPKIERLIPTDHITEAARKVMLAQLAEVLEHEQIARLGQDVEGVHKMRVATRRWRSSFKVFDGHIPPSYNKHILPNLRWTAHRLGAVRDLDVFLQKTRMYIQSELGDDPTVLNELLQIVGEDRHRAHRELCKWFDQKKYQRFIQRSFRLLVKPNHGTADVYNRKQPLTNRLDHFLPVMIYKRFEAVRRYEEVLDTAPIELLHKLRIDCKRLRYTLEAFVDVLGESVMLVILAVKAIQTHLGDMNDAGVAVEITRAIQKRIQSKDSKKAVKKYRKARQEEEQILATTFLEVWDTFNRREIREALASAIAVL